MGGGGGGGRFDSRISAPMDRCVGGGGGGGSRVSAPMDRCVWGLSVELVHQWMWGAG